jgi:hypothetical protein
MAQHSAFENANGKIVELEKMEAKVYLEVGD